MKSPASMFLLLALYAPLMAQDTSPAATPSLRLTVEPAGDTTEGVVVRIIAEYLQNATTLNGDVVLSGSIESEGHPTRTFRRTLRQEEIASSTIIQTLPSGKWTFAARLHVMNDSGTPLLLGRAETTVELVPVGRPYEMNSTDGVAGMLAEGVVPESAGAVTIRSARRDLAPNLFTVAVDVKPPVRRVEFWIGDRRIFTRNAPPYVAELDLGTLPRRVEVKAIGYDTRGRYIDADVVVVSERDNPLEVKIIRTETKDGVSQIRVAVQNRPGVNVAGVELYADDKRLIRWERPPYAYAIPTDSLSEVRFLRASATDGAGLEATDLLFMDGTGYVEEIEVNLVELPVSVTTRSGAAVTDLQRNEFVVKENGRPVEITKFDFAANLPLTVGVMVDHSGSMVERIDIARAAALQFFRSVLGERDRGFFGGFSWDATSVSPVVSDLGALQMQALSMPDPEGATALYDAVVAGLYQFRGIEGRRALIVVTDGEDTASRTDYDDVLRYARSARVPIYVIGIGLSSMTSGRIRGLSAETGGNVYYIRSTDQLAATYERLERELRTQYLLGYYAEGAKPDEYRTVEVTIPGRSGLNIRTIRGYLP